MRIFLFLPLAIAAMVQHASAGAQETPVLSLDSESLPPNLTQNNVQATMITFEGRHAMAVDFRVVDWPNVYFTPGGGTWDWSAHAGLAVTLYNPGDDAVAVCMRVDNAGADGLTHCNTASATVPPKEHAPLEMRFNTGDAGGLWGMRGLPVLGPRPSGPVIDTTRISAFQVFLPQPASACTLILEEAHLFGPGGSPGALVPLPFVDRLGQYRHQDWPGKVHKEAELPKRQADEDAAIARAPELPDRDTFGGWAEGPQREATGWFRTEQVDGVWWLVTPDGHLFFSVGIDCVGTWERTFVTGRDGWFEWLPGREDPRFGNLFSEVSGAHSMAETIDGKGLTFGFYTANLIRKYGEAWPEKWRDSAYRRLRHWGFNTVGNWSQGDVLDHSPLPFVVALGISGDAREVTGAAGYWGKMKDVFDAKFGEAVDASLREPAARYADNPLCIGYFVDNELSWEAVRRGVLASPPDQPARQAFIAQLEAAYVSLDALNRAWETAAADWDAVRSPEKPNAAATKDIDQFEYAFARRYYETVAAALRRLAPNHLYLGSRFSSAPAIAVRACADVADVVSFNRYERRIRCENYTGANDLGKPILIGEFHFGALDRGMFHPGLVNAKDQKTRGEFYAAYIRAVADCPAFVGCHWFQFVDEPITGRWFDGENYNIGFLSVTDSPYPELVEAARQVHAEIYARHRGAQSLGTK